MMIEPGILRIVFTSDDLARVRIAPRVDPLWEMAMSLYRLQGRDGNAALRGWRRKVRADLMETGLLSQVRERLIPLVPPGAYFPDFLTPFEALAGLEQGLDALADTPKARLRREMGVLHAHRGLPGAAEDLARGDARSLRSLVGVVDAYCQAAFAPERARMERAVGHERATLTRNLFEHGVEHMLARVSPSMRWRPPALETAYPAGNHEINLGGRGLTLIPSYFCRVTPVALFDQQLPPVLVYPAAHHPLPGATDRDRLADLLGGTRAAMLRCIGARGGCTTSELAHRTGVSVSNASKHAQVLHHSGLIVSTRRANTVVHMVSDLGAGLLRHNADHLGVFHLS